MENTAAPATPTAQAEAPVEKVESKAAEPTAEKPNSTKLLDYARKEAEFAKKEVARKEEIAALVDLADHIDCTLVLLNDLSADMQAKAGSPDGSFGLWNTIKAFKQVADIFLWNPHSFVYHFYFNEAVFLAGTQEDYGPGRIFCSIGKKVVEYLSNTSCIGIDFR